MKRNVIETVLGGVVLLVAAGFLVFAFLATGLSSGDGYEITAQFDDASGLVSGPPVRGCGGVGPSILPQKEGRVAAGS